jgi:hypothetical protein
MNTKYKSSRIKRLSFNRIFVSKAEVKHTNSKSIITIYTYNREKIALLKKIQKLIGIGFLNKGFIQKVKLNLINKIFLFFFKGKKIYSNINTNLFQKAIRLIFSKKLILIRRFILKLHLNKFKSEEKFLQRLAKLISKFYKKKIEFNIINLKSIVLNSDLFTEIMTLKLKKRKINVLKLMNIILTKVKLLKINRLKERSRKIKTINYDLFENKYRNPNLNFILNTSLNSKETFNKFFSKLYDEENNIIEKNNKISIKKTLLKNIKYKTLGGIRLEVKGRLTRRYRADRALFKVK